MGLFDRVGSGLLRMLACGTGGRRRERVVAGTGCGSFADLLRPFCLADWSDEFSTNDRNGVSLSHGPIRE